MKKGNIFRIGIVLGLLTIAIFYLLGHLTKPSIASFELQGISDLTPRSFSIQGSFLIKNPAKIIIPVESISYDIFLKDTGKRIGAGSIPAFSLESQSITPVQFGQEVEWIPAAELAASLLIQEHVWVSVKGEAVVAVPRVGTYGIPFESEVDIKEYLLQATGTDPLPGEEQPSRTLEDVLKKTDGVVPLP